jgi:hypothetical protein
MRTRCSITVLFPAVVLVGAAVPPASQAADQDLGPATFSRLHRLIRPQPGESRWMEIPWLIDLHEARTKAAAEGKPLFVMSGGGATAIGPC